MSAICFDLDGTLTDPKEGIVGSIRYALEKLGHEVSSNDDDLTWCIGPPLLGSFETLVGSKQEAEQALVFYRERFGDIGLFENEVYPGIRDVLQGLAADGRRLFVATSKPTVYAARILRHFELSDYFDTIFGSELDGTRADKTDLLAWVVGQANLEPSTTMMIGDRRHDVVGAKNNGIGTIGVLYGYGERAELVEAGADHLCEAPEKLLNTLGYGH
ncbi:MAG: HAD family hydrolase [Alphaproteobacteria bacterium]|nr:HAD family hydrolase [Alphaproteobacteria bacterium]